MHRQWRQLLRRAGSAAARAFRRRLAPEARACFYVLLVVLLFALIHPPEGFGFDGCVWHRLTGRPCPGCGLTRSVTAVLHGQWGQAWHCHPFGFLPPAVFLLIAAAAALPAEGRRRLDEIIRRRSGLWRIGGVLAAIYLVFGLSRLLGAAPSPESAPMPKEYQTPPPAQPDDAGGMIYTNANAGIKVAAGAVFTIRLPSNPTTGYQWRLADLPADAPARLREHRFDPPAVARIGAGGHEIWVFEGMRPGAMAVAMAYLRPWEPDQPHTQCFFKVEILPAAK